MSVQEVQVQSLQSLPTEYTDEYLVEQDEMGSNNPQSICMTHNKSALEIYFEPQGVRVSSELNHYHRAVNNSQNLIVPDIAVFKGVEIASEQWRILASWDMRKPGHPPPPVVIELSSKETYTVDISLPSKPRVYGLIGVKEYFAYDPNEPQVWLNRAGLEVKIAAGQRLMGWRYDGAGQPVLIEVEQRGERAGWLWSEELGLWLAPAGQLLEFYTAGGQRLLDGRELAQQQKVARQQAERVALQAQRNARQAQQLAQQAEQNARQETQARRQAEQNARQAEQAQQQAEQNARQEAQARQQAEQNARQEAQARQQAEQNAQQEAQARQQAEQAQQEAEELTRQAEQARQQADDTARSVAQELAEVRRQLEEMRRQQGYH